MFFSSIICIYKYLIVDHARNRSTSDKDLSFKQNLIFQGNAEDEK